MDSRLKEGDRIGNQIDQVPPLKYINWDDKVSHFVRGRKVLGDMKYLIIIIIIIIIIANIKGSAPVFKFLDYKVLMYRYIV